MLVLWRMEDPHRFQAPYASHVSHLLSGLLSMSMMTTDFFISNGCLSTIVTNDIMFNEYMHLHVHAFCIWPLASLASPQGPTEPPYNLVSRNHHHNHNHTLDYSCGSEATIIHSFGGLSSQSQGDNSIKFALPGLPKSPHQPFHSLFNTFVVALLFQTFHSQSPQPDHFTTAAVA